MRAHRWLRLRLALVILLATVVVVWIAFANVLVLFRLLEWLGAP